MKMKPTRKEDIEAHKQLKIEIAEQLTIMEVVKAIIKS